MNAQTPVKRRRLNPEARKALILDHAADIVAREGMSVLTMERIGKDAGISKSLVYTYFDNLTELLRTLLQRELRRLRRAQASAAGKAHTFEDMVRGVTHEYLKYIEERGLIIERLQSDPNISEGSNPTDYDREDAVKYIADIISRNFDLPYDLARASADISFGIPAQAGAYFLHNDVTREEVENITVTMIIGTLTALKNDYSTRQRPLKRDTDA